MGGTASVSENSELSSRDGSAVSMASAISTYLRGSKRNKVNTSTTKCTERDENLPVEQHERQIGIRAAKLATQVSSLIVRLISRNKLWIFQHRDCAFCRNLFESQTLRREQDALIMYSHQQVQQLTLELFVRSTQFVGDIEEDIPERRKC